MLKLRNITKTYITGDLQINALNNVSLDFRRSEFVSVLGQSGCGKTTMLNIVGGLDRYTEGDLIIDGKSTRDFNNHDWDAYRNHCIGYVFQSYNLIPHLTVLGNVELALTISGESMAERKKRAANALNKVGLGNQLSKRPNQLSGGQMQRVAIARALVNDPQIILADEPTGALDSKTSVQIMELLKEVASDRLVILVTHNNALAETYSTRIVRLSDGEIVDDSNPVGEEEQRAIAAAEVKQGSSIWKKSKKQATGAGNAAENGQSVSTQNINGIAQNSNGTEQSLNETGQNLNGTAQNINTTKQDSNGTEQNSGRSVSTQKLNETTQNEKRTNLNETAQNSNVSAQQNKSQTTTTTHNQNSNINNQKQEKVKIKRTSMSFFTALNLSFRNLWSKRGRTFMVSFAGSIGIIGIALVLAISNGFKLYINKIETETLANFPVSVSRTAIDLESIQSGMVQGERRQSFPEDGTSVGFVESQNSMSAYIKTNVLTKEYINYVDGIKSLTSQSGSYRGQSLALDVQKSYAITMPVVTEYDRSGDARMVNTRQSSSSMLSMFGGGSSSRFSEMLDNPEFIAQQYDVLHGSYPANYNEIALIIDDTNGISKSLAKNLGFNENLDELDFDKIVGKKYKLILNDAYYITDSQTKEARAIDTSDKDVLREIFDRADGDGVIELSISGIMRVNKNAVLEMYGSGLVYLPSLTEKYLSDCETAEIAGLQAAALDLSGEAGMGMGDLQVYKALFSESELDNDFLSVREFYQSMETMLNMLDLIPSKALQIASVVEGIKRGTGAEMGEGDELAMLTQLLEGMGDDGIELFATMLVYLGESLEEFNDDASMTFGIPVYYFKEMLGGNIFGKQELKESVMQIIGIGGLPTSINIYPRSFETKKEILAYLEQWNVAHPDHTITATDPAAMLSGTMGQMIDIISYVLIAFAAVSLVVSSIMIGIITYVSVIERTKEIGVLRSIGARKKDIGNVFNAETVIIGFAAGLIGVLVAYLLCIPINAIIGVLAGSAVVGNLAVLNPLHALILIGVSTVLTLISGLIPSSIAAKKDPVVALRSE